MPGLVPVEVVGVRGMLTFQEMCGSCLANLRKIILDIEIEIKNGALP